MSAPSARPADSPAGVAAKVQAQHLKRLAVVYVRQSSLEQVRKNQESTRLQYGLVESATGLGWARDRVVIIDDDLGVSAATAGSRPGFQRLLGEVALEHVGIILGAEISRLARSCREWHQLLELCAVFGTLILDQDGLYDPASFNDRLLLGLKGTISEAELHVLKQRMLQGRMQKARRGELRIAAPIGYVVGPSGALVLDPDEEARAVVATVFDQFERLGTVPKVHRYLIDNGLKVGVRARGGLSKGELEWRRPNIATLYCMLHNPIYAGAYVYGRRRTDPRRRRPDQPHGGRRLVPMEEWEVCLKDHLPAYISWEQFEANLARLKSNRLTKATPGATRRGVALLSGLVYCAHCGSRMRPWYSAAGSAEARYLCLGPEEQYGGARCQSLQTVAVDAEVSRLLLKALEPASLEVSLRVAEDLEAEKGRELAAWRRRLERAMIEVERAERQYQAVEPENRLVARTLEGAWEEKLRTLQRLEEEHARFLRDAPRGMTTEERDQIRALASDLPGLWAAETTTVEDRKAIIREVIERVIVGVQDGTEVVEMAIHWIGGHITHTRVRRKVGSLSQLSNYAELKARILSLAGSGMNARRIAEQLKLEGWRSPTGLAGLHVTTVRSHLRRAGLVRQYSSRDTSDLRPDETPLPRLAEELGMHRATLSAWVKRGWVSARQLEGLDRRWVIQADEQEKRRLAELHARQRRKRR